MCIPSAGRAASPSDQDDKRGVAAGIDIISRAVTGAAMVQVLRAAAELGLAEALAAGPADVTTLADRLGCDRGAMRRLLGALASLGLCEQGSGDVFALSEAGAVLRAGHVPSLHHWMLWWGRYMWPEWAQLTESVRTGESGRTLSRRGAAFEHLEHDVEAASTFHAAMAELTHLVTSAVAQHEVFAGAELVVDVGGGRGELLGEILLRHRHLRGVLFERPHAIAAAHEAFARAGLSPRVELATGDFMQSVAAGGDVYLLKSILHDWDDERGAIILRHCARAMRPSGRVLIIEQIMPDRMERSPAHQELARRDLTMMIGPGGRERTEREFRQLVAQGGLTCRTIRAAAMGFHVIEATS